MPRLRSMLNPEEQPELIESPTRYRVGPNQSELVCGFCNETYYVDDVTFRQAMLAMEEGIDNPFCCLAQKVHSCWRLAAFLAVSLWLTVRAPGI